MEKENLTNNEGLIKDQKTYLFESKVSPTFYTRLFGKNKPFEAFCETIDNAKDAGAKRVSIIAEPVPTDIEYKRKDPRPYTITFKDDGCGFDIDTLNDALSYGVPKDYAEGSLGHNNCGLKAAPYYLISDESDEVYEKIESNHKKTKIIVQKKISMTDDSENLMNNVMYGSTFDRNGTTITFDNVIISEAALDDIINRISIRYFNALESKQFSLTYNGNTLRGMDMLYRTKNAKNCISAHFDLVDGSKKYTADVIMSDVGSYAKTLNDKGTTSWDITKLNKIDASDMHRTQNPDYAGIYICINGVYIVMGGVDTWMHVGRKYHSDLSGYRIEVNLSSNCDFIKKNIIKTQTSEYLPNYKKKNGRDLLFSPFIKWFKDNSPARVIRQRNQEDIKKLRRNRTVENLDKMYQLASLFIANENDIQNAKNLCTLVMACFEGKKIEWKKTSALVPVIKP